MNENFIVTREALRGVLLDWQSGAFTANQTHTWAEDRYAASAFTPADEVANEVLAELDMLDVNLRTPEDIPVFLRMLEVAGDDPDAAAAILEAHAQSIDLDERRRRLAVDAFYAPFCS